MLKLPIIVSTVLFLACVGHVEKCSCQYAAKRVKTPGGYVTETNESYWYIRGENSYDALAIRSVRLNVNGKIKYRLNVKCTTSLADTITQIKILAADSGLTTKLLVLTGTQKVDNPKVKCTVYRTDLSADDIKYFSTHHLKSLLVFHAKANTETNIPVADDQFLIKQISCLKKSVL